MPMSTDIGATSAYLYENTLEGGLARSIEAWSYIHMPHLPSSLRKT
jgi:hypothetical protein